MVEIKFMIIIIGIIFLALFGGINYYIGNRGWQGISSILPFLGSRLYWSLFWGVSMSYIISRFAGGYMPDIVKKTIEIIGAYWLAIMFYLLMFVVLIDVLRLINRRLKFFPDAFTQGSKVVYITSVLIILILVILMVFGAWNSSHIAITNYNIDINKTCGNLKELKVVMVSDIHLGNIVDNRRLTKIIDKINSLEPDILLIPGDIIDDVTEPFEKQNMRMNFMRLRVKYGVYACLGNHDGMLQSAQKTVEVLENAGIKILRDEALLIDDLFYIVGRDDNTVYRGSSLKRKNLSDILLKDDKAKPFIVMDHQPYRLQEAEEEGVDLQLSGHTHKGQMFPSNLITNSIYEIDYGYLKKGNTHIIVSSGVGTWGPPIRIGSRSEIVEVKINFK